MPSRKSCRPGGGDCGTTATDQRKSKKTRSGISDLEDSESLDNALYALLGNEPLTDCMRKSRESTRAKSCTKSTSSKPNRQRKKATDTCIADAMESSTSRGTKSRATSISESCSVLTKSTSSKSKLQKKKTTATCVQCTTPCCMLKPTASRAIKPKKMSMSCSATSSCRRRRQSSTSSCCEDFFSESESDDDTFYKCCR